MLMQTIAEVLKKIEDYSISNRAEFEALVKKNLAMQQTDQTKKQQKRIPQITTRLEQIDKVLNKLYEDNALGTIPQDRYCALLGYIIFEGAEEDRNMNTLVDMISGMEVKEDDEDFLNAVDYMFKGLEQRKPNCFAVKQYKKYKLSSGDICSK